MNLDELRARLAKMQALRSAHPYTAEWVDGEILALRQSIEDVTHAQAEGFVGAMEWQYVAAIVVAVSALALAGALFIARAV